MLSYRLYLLLSLLIFSTYAESPAEESQLTTLEDDTVAMEDDTVPCRFVRTAKLRAPVSPLSAFAGNDNGVQHEYVFYQVQ